MNLLVIESILFELKSQIVEVFNFDKIHYEFIIQKVVNKITWHCIIFTLKHLRR
jgi:hypothetical protein